MSKPFNLLNMVDKFLEEDDKKKLDSRERTSHHPSGANKCLRQMYFDWTQEPVSNYRTATDCYRMLIGTWIHKGFADLLKRMGLDVEEEVELTITHPSLHYPIHGYMDNVLRIEGNVYGIELKSTFGRGIVNIQKEGKPREDDEVQSKIYLCNMFKDFSGYFLDYLGRDSFYRTEFYFELEQKDKEKFMDNIIKKFAGLELNVTNKIMPYRDYQAVVKDGEIKDKIQFKNVEYKSDWQCLYCVYRDRCYREEIKSCGIYTGERRLA